MPGGGNTSLKGRVSAGRRDAALAELGGPSPM